MTAMSGSSWEELRKQARLLENDIDVKLVAFSKLGVSSVNAGLSSESVPLINSDDMFDTMSMELQQLLNKLSSINDKMADLAPSGTATMHTIKRHREILMDYQQEFSKTSARVNARREREELLRGGSPPPGATIGLSRRDQYTKEANHLHSSHILVDEQINIAMEAREHLASQRQTFKRMQTTFNNITNRYSYNDIIKCSSHILVDEQINIAMEAREHLASQRQTFKRMQTTFNNITNRFPMLNSLIYRINARKRRDSLIIGLVVAVCTFLLLLYAFH